MHRIQIVTNYSVTVIEEYHYYCTGHKILTTVPKNRPKIHTNHMTGETRQD